MNNSSTILKEQGFPDSKTISTLNKCMIELICLISLEKTELINELTFLLDKRHLICSKSNSNGF